MGFSTVWKGLKSLKFEHFFLAIRCVAADARSASAGLLIQASISMEVVPEMVSLPVLQHQIPNFRIKPGKCYMEFTHLPSLLLSQLPAINEFHYNARIAEKTTFTDAKSDPVWNRHSSAKSPFTLDGIMLGDRLGRTRSLWGRTSLWRRTSSVVAMYVMLCYLDVLDSMEELCNTELSNNKKKNLKKLTS